MFSGTDDDWPEHCNDLMELVETCGICNQPGDGDMVCCPICPQLFHNQCLIDSGRECDHFGFEWDPLPEEEVNLSFSPDSLSKSIASHHDDAKKMAEAVAFYYEGEEEKPKTKPIERGRMHTVAIAGNSRWSRVPSGPRRHTCMRCEKAKTKCVYKGGNGPCERCARLEVECVRPLVKTSNIV